MGQNYVVLRLKLSPKTAKQVSSISLQMDMVEAMPVLPCMERLMPKNGLTKLKHLGIVLIQVEAKVIRGSRGNTAKAVIQTFAFGMTTEIPMC